MANVAVHATGPGGHYAAAPRWRPLAHSLALATLGATCVLIILGGLVTNTGAALAVPDWPSTFGYNMMLFPWSSATVQNRAVTTRIVEYIGFPTQ